MTPTITVTMVARNEERFIEQALDAIQAQTVTPSEIVVVDDASTDRTGEIVQAYRGPAPIRYIRHDEPLGSIAARNRAIGEASGEIVGECDADDIWLPRKLERQLEVLLDGVDGRTVAVVGCAGRNITEDGSDAGAFVVGMNSPEEFDRALAGSELLVVPHSSVIFRAEHFHAVGGYLEDYLGAEDTELWERMAQFGVVMNVAEPLFLYRKKLGGLMQTQFWRQQVNFMRILGNRERKRHGLEPMGYEEFEALLRSRPRRERWSRKRNWYGKYCYRFGATNFVNGRKGLGGAQLVAAALLDPARMRAGAGRYIATRTRRA